MTIGLLGGTFDPIHLGHLDVGRAAQRALDLDEIWIVPARRPPHRHRPLASAAHRFAMAALALAGEPRFRLSDIEMDRQGPSYTIDTLGALETDHRPGRAFVFVIGADAFRDVPSWRAFPAVLDRVHFVVVSRPGHRATGLRAALPALASRMVDVPCAIPAHPSILLLDAPTADVSSTDVRHRLLTGQPVTGLVPDVVAAYVEKHGLYGPGSTDPAGPASGVTEETEHA
jgi:nicotinate-nucleotide adenylyltransferase